MKKKFITSAVFGLLFMVLIAMLCTFDVQPIGPEGTEIGFAMLNSTVRGTLGESDTWYKISELFGYLSIASAGIFVILGVWQMISRKSLLKVDKKLYALAGLYAVTVFFYAFFEVVIINYRPIIEAGAEHVEASFPSSHTMLSCVTMGSAFVMLDHYVKNKGLRVSLQYVCLFMATIITVGRLLSGVHWLTDILGGVFLSVALVTLFSGVCNAIEKKDKE
jgi:undecaprenyl-diphosphatase